MRRFLGCAIAATLILGVSNIASAGILANYLTFDGQEDTLTDESRTAFVDNGDGVFSNGDILYGMLRISNVIASGVGNQPVMDQVAFVFSYELTGGGGAVPFTFSPIGNAASPYDLRTLLAGTGVLPALGASTFDDAIAIAISNPSTADADNPLNFGPDTAAGPSIGTTTGQLQNFTTANGWSYDALFGHVAPPNQHGDTDYLDSTVLAPVPGTVLGFQSGGFSVLDHVWGSDVDFLAVTATHLDGSLSDHDVTLDIPTSFTNVGAPSPWTFTDNASFTINATPEPASMLAWAGLGMFGLTWVRRRRRRAA